MCNKHHKEWVSFVMHLQACPSWFLENVWVGGKFTLGFALCKGRAVLAVD